MKNLSTKITDKRCFGVLMPISSLSGPYGIGTMGADAYSFVDWLASSGARIWQVLPFIPTGYGNSPYQGCDSSAFNFYLIDLDLLAEEGLLDKSDYAEERWCETPSRIDYGKQFVLKPKVLRKAFERFDKSSSEWQDFIKSGVYARFAEFMTLKEKFLYAPWRAWGEEYSHPQAPAVEQLRKDYPQEILFWQFTQFIFLKQWRALKAYANQKGIYIFGDMPIYVAEDSVEMWETRYELFLLDEEGNQSMQAGVPPDAFSDDGQLWGNPVYNWPLMREKGYLWWKNRIKSSFDIYDVVRIDHFRAFDKYFACDMLATTAVNGEWYAGPGAELFEGLEEYNVVAEDLGVIDDDVRLLLKKTGYPGMRVAQFSFDGLADCEHKANNVTENYVAYTGTHDNPPLRAYLEALDGEEERVFYADLRHQCLKTRKKWHGNGIRQRFDTIVNLYASCRANVFIMPMQDVCYLGDEARINAPAVCDDSNWSFRFSRDHFTAERAQWLYSLAKSSGRLR